MNEYCFNILFQSNEDLPKGDDFWMIAEGLSLFPGHKGMLTIWDLNTPGRPILTMKSQVLGKVISAKETASKEVTWCGGFDPVDNSPEGLLRFAVFPGGIRLGQPTLPRVCVVVSKTVMDSLGNGQFNIVLEKLLELIGRTRAVWGFVDLFPTQMSQNGRAFGTIGDSDTSLIMLARDAVWRARSRKGICLSGIHWGNFLGNELLAKVGGRATFLEMLTRELTLPNGKLVGIIRELESGVFFSLCHTPEEFTSDFTVRDILKWFAELLVDHDLL